MSSRQPSLFPDDRPRWSRDDPAPERPPHSGGPTSRAAAVSKAPTAAQQRTRVLLWISGRGELGATAEEIQEGLGLSGDSVRPRLWELRGNAGHDRVVEDSGSHRPTRAGRAAVVWVLKRRAR